MASVSACGDLAMWLMRAHTASSGETSVIVVTGSRDCSRLITVPSCFCALQRFTFRIRGIDLPEKKAIYVSTYRRSCLVSHALCATD